MKKILLFAAAASISAASAAGLFFQDLKKLETVDGYTAYGMQSELTQEAYIWVDGGEKDGQIASINLNNVLGGEAEFAIVKGKTLAEYADNSDRAEFYQTQCADKTLPDRCYPHIPPASCPSLWQIPLLRPIRCLD